MELKQLAEQFPDTEEDKPLVTKSANPTPRARAQVSRGRSFPAPSTTLEFLSWNVNFPVQGAAVSEVWLDEAEIDPQPE